MGVESQRSARSTPSKLSEVVVGLDGSASSLAALRWAVAQVGPDGRVHAAHVIVPAEEPALDTAPDDSVHLIVRREEEVRDRWIESVRTAGAGPTIDAVVREGHVAHELVRLAGQVDADAIVVGHHAQARLGPQLVGHVTAGLLHAADRPIVVVPLDWAPERTAGRAVAVGVGSAGGTETALRWALAQPDAVRAGLLLVHAYGPRTVFRPDGWLDVLAYHLDPTVLPEWVEQDLLELADRLSEESGADVEVSVSVQPGRTGARLVEAGAGAGMLVVGRGEPPFIRSHTIAPYLRHAIVHAPCPVVVVPADDR